MTTIRAHFVVTIGGDVTESPHPTEPEPNDEDRWKAKTLAEGGNFDKDVEDLFARAMAIGRSGGNIEAFLREQLRR